MKFLRFVVTVAMLLAIFVVMLGAYTRLTDAGLGCPDWPGCYGHMVLPTAKNKLSEVQNQYPHTLIESRKAWTEMAHRYAAGTLALLIVIIGVSALYWKVIKKRRFPWVLPLLLMILVVFQAALGMWTVTLKLLPVVVMGHLLGGVLIFASLCYYRLQLSGIKSQRLSTWHGWVMLGVVLIFCQIALGGWVSSNYAGIACIGFPQCNGQWLPALHFSQGFNLFSPVGANYQGGVLDNEVRVTIQWIHRLGAVIVAGYLLLLALFMITNVKTKNIRRLGALVILLVLSQFTLGILNVVYLLPLWVAVLHNGVAALLFATILALYYVSKGEKPYA